MPRPLACVVASLLVALIAGGAAGAQPVPPGTLPVTPNPTECGIASRDAEEIATLAGPLSATPVAGTAETAVASDGEIADPATAAFVGAIVREALACGNAAGFAGAASLVTDTALAGATAEVLTFAAGTPAPPPEERRALLDVREVRVLDDGRVSALVVVAASTRSPAETAYAVLLAEGAAGTGGSGQYLYLIDGLAPAPAGRLATPIAATPAA